MRTKEEIQKQIDGLKKMKTWLAEYSFFGDPNHKGIDAQLDILEKLKYIDDFDEFNEDDFDSEEEHGYIRQQAETANDWLTEYSNVDLFDEN